ncbi:hemerythrin domain-containing protein [Saccharopolyspora thermophila]|uniref:hemerythrin domain-containing protein n=1 Tax=Saccharopolyspora thermophila TaxID=89367 RepID=UPI0031F9ED82
MALRPVSGGPPNAASPGAGLKLLHDAFRRELSLIRREIAESGPGIGAQLRVNCLTVCQGLRNHHTGEDTTMFPFLTEHHPELAPVLERLRAEHERIATLVAELYKVVSSTAADPALVRAEVDRLADELERHLAHEEEQLIPVLDA